MHELLEARCGACGFSLKGIDAIRARRERACALCGGPLVVRHNLSVSRRLPAGTLLLMGAFAASIDASPLDAYEAPPSPGFARPRRPPVNLDELLATA